MRRVSAATAPAGIKDVLFKEMLVQWLFEIYTMCIVTDL
jgi:hypothetical protein